MMNDDFDPYSVLNVNPNDDLETVRDSYKKLIKKTHPDIGGDKRTFQIIQNAYDCIVNNSKQQSPSIIKISVSLPIYDLLLGCDVAVEITDGIHAGKIIAFSVPMNTMPGTILEFIDDNLTNQTFHIKLLKTKEKY